MRTFIFLVTFALTVSLGIADQTNGAGQSAGESWGVVSGSPSSDRRGATDWDNTDRSFGSRQDVKDTTFGIGIGKYGTLGAELNFRTSDAFGFSLGLGGQYYQAEWQETYTRTEYYTTYKYVYANPYAPSVRIPVRQSRQRSYSEAREDSGFAAMGGGKLHFYFTPKSARNQHNIFLALYYGEAIGPAYGIAYGFEHHGASGAGWDFSIGAVAAPDAESQMAEKVGASEEDIDYTWIPVLIELGVFF